MSLLTYKRDRGAFVFFADDPKDVLLAKEIGMDRSKPMSTPKRQVFFTREEYAAVPLWSFADESARGALAARHVEYEESWRTESGAHIAKPGDVEYMSFQKAGIEYALNRPHALIGDAPGLGKTIQAIGVANEMGAKRVLVICPASVRLQWQKEIRIWSTIPKVSTYPILKSKDGVSPRAHYTIISYDLARHEVIHDMLNRLRVDLLVLDEAHYLKSYDARRTRAVFGGAGWRALAERAGKTLALTGTPLPNRPRECYTIARGLCWESIDFMSEDAFKWRYNPSLMLPSGRVAEKTGRLPELQARLRCNFMVRRLKEDVLTQLPEAVAELTYVEPNGEIRKVLREERLLNIDPLHLENVEMSIQGHVSTVRREMGIAKAPRVVEHVKMLLDGGVEKIVVFAWHKQVLDILEDGLGQYGTVRVDGQVTATAKYQRVQAFQKDLSIRVLIGNLMASGTGTDGLQNVASHAVFAEASWTMGENQQCIDRLHRHGQHYNVLAQFVVAPGSFDERVLGASIRKGRTVRSALDERVA